MQPFTRVDDVDIGVCPDPGSNLVCIVLQDEGVLEDNVAEDSAVRALEKVQGKDCVPVACWPQMITEWGLVGRSIKH